MNPFDNDGIRPDIQAPADPRGGFKHNPAFNVHTTIDNGGIVDGNTNATIAPQWNDGANP